MYFNQPVGRACQFWSSFSYQAVLFFHKAGQCLARVRIISSEFGEAKQGKNIGLDQ